MSTFEGGAAGTEALLTEFNIVILFLVQFVCVYNIILINV